jgi:predicted dehydrogenase
MTEHRIAIIGIGNASKPHVAAIGELPNATLVGGSCRSADKGRAWAEENDAPWFDDAERMLAEVKPTVAIVCTPSGAHLPIVRQCAAAGVHVLCEKPLEITLERVDQMRQAADDAGIQLGGVFQQRYNEAVQLAHQAAGEGRFGTLAFAGATVPWWRDDDYYAPQRWQGTKELDGGGALINQAIHAVDALQWIAAAAQPELADDQNPVAEVFAYTGRRGHDPKLIEVEDTAVAVLRYRNGAMGYLLAATSMYPGSLRRLQVGGRDGMIEILESDLNTWQFRDEREEDEKIRQRLIGRNVDNKSASDPMAFSHENHRQLLEAFLAALDSDEPYLLTPIEARKSVAIIRAVYESAGSGKPAAVD